MSRIDRFFDRFIKVLDFLQDHWRFVVPMLLWVVGVIFTFVLGNRWVGWFFMGASITFSITNLVITVTGGRGPWRKKHTPEKRKAAFDDQMAFSLDPIHGMVSTLACERCGQEHKDVNEAYRWHVRRRIWLDYHSADETIMGRTVRYHLKSEKDFLGDLGLLLTDFDRTYIEQVERMDFVFQSWGP